MPELPEVETVARGLRALLVGRTIIGVDVLWPRSLIPPDPPAFIRRVAGQMVADVTRRGKWLVIALSGGETVLIHLRMSGRLSIESQACLDPRHLRALFTLDDGQRLGFFDQRKFGRLHATDDPDRILQALGPEPLSGTFTPDRMAAMLRGRRGHLKPLLADQRFLAGLGNIYTDEALWLARLHPLRRADALTYDEANRLHAAIQNVLRAAIESGGTTLEDESYRQPDGQAGKFARWLAVYGREGKACLRCGQAIQRIKVGQRGAHLCPNCQPIEGENANRPVR